MYEKHWQLASRPFDDQFEPRFYYPAESHQGALFKLRYALEQGRGIATLTGPNGIGKTWLISLLKRQLADSFAPFCQVTFPAMPQADFLAYFAEELSGTRFAAAPSPRESLRRIEDTLWKAHQEQRRPLMVLDEAHLLNDPTILESLRLLLNLLPGQNPLSMLFVGHSTLLAALARFPALDDRIAVKCQLQALSREEAAGYVTHRLRQAGAKRDLLDTAALDTLHELTHGIPRRINRLCDLALVVGYAQGNAALTAELLESVHDELLQVTV
jgi:type II secretory pathway predicted ATPase ExeA